MFIVLAQVLPDNTARASLMAKNSYRETPAHLAAGDDKVTALRCLQELVPAALEAIDEDGNRILKALIKLPINTQRNNIMIVKLTCILSCLRRKKQMVSKWPEIGGNKHLSA